MAKKHTLLSILLCSVLAFHFIPAGLVIDISQAEAATYKKPVKNKVAKPAKAKNKTAKKALRKKIPKTTKKTASAKKHGVSSLSKKNATKDAPAKTQKEKKNVSGFDKIRHSNKNNKAVINKPTLQNLKKLKNTNKIKIRKQIESQFVGKKQNFGGGKVAYWGNIKNDDIAVARIEVSRKGLQVTDLYKGSLTSGSGSILLAHTIKYHGIKIGKSITLNNIKNKETMSAYKKGIKAEKSLLGRVVNNAMHELGLKPKHMRYNLVGDKLNIEVTMR